MDEPDKAGTPAPQFRTYASDVAKLTGKPPEKDLKNVLPPSKPVPATPVPQPPVPVPQKPYEPPPATIIPKAPSTDEAKEAVLARLKAKGAAKVQAAAPTPVQKTPYEPPPAAIIPKAPSTDEAKEAVLARLRSKVATPTVPPAAAAPVAASSPIHTYKSDFSDKTKKENATPISVLAAEQNAGTRNAPPPLKEGKKNYAVVIAVGAILIIAGSASVFFAYSFATGRPLVPFAPIVPSLIFAESHVEIAGTDAELQTALVALANDVRPGEAVIAYVTLASTTPEGTEIMVPAEGGMLVEALGLPAPNIVLRNVEPASTVGVISAGSETRPFFLLRVASYERTFAGMLSWEPTMGTDLGLFYPEHPAPEPVGTSTAPVVTVNSVFYDEVIANHDARVLRDSLGRAVIIYGYRDKETLIIARDEAAFEELLSRLAATRAR